MGLFTQRRNLGLLLLGIWLIAHGMLSLVSVSVPFSGLLLPVLAITAGILIVLGR